MIADGSSSVVSPFAIHSFKFILSFVAAPKITIENDENENEHDAWTEYRHLFENNRSHSLNPSSMGNNYLLRHSSANTSLSESSSLEPMTDNHDDLLSIIEQAGINFGKHERCSMCHRLVGACFLEALTGSSSMDLLASTSGYHSYEPSPMNHRSKRSSLLDPSAAEFSMEAESALLSTSQSIQRSSYQSDRSSRRCSRTQSHASPRIATSCNYPC